MEKKNNNILLIVVLVLIILGLVGFIVCAKLYTNSNSTNEMNVIENNNRDNSNVNESLSVDSFAVVNAMEMMGHLVISNNDLYKQNSYSISNVSNDDLIATALQNINKDYIAYCISDSSLLKNPITIQELNTVLNKYVLNKTITTDMIKSLNQSSYPLAQYEINNIGIILNDNSVRLIGSCGSEFSAKDYINKKIVNAELNNDYLYVYEKQAFAKYNGDFSVNYYKDYNKTIVLENNLDGMPNWNLYDTYKYTFKIVDGNYYFQSFELVNG